jgi:putative SOS response-associated peptidase YedK
VCGRFTQTDPERIAREFSVTGQVPRLAVGARFNVAPTQPVAVVRLLDAAKGRQLDTLRWGLVPAWAADPSIGNRMINARVETLAEKPAFRDALRLRRCLVVADGFYEWQRQGRAKQPFYIRKIDGALLAMAALWDRWTSSDGEIIETFTVITKPSVPPVTAIHDRMPAILAEASHAAWLNPELRNADTLLPLLTGPSPELLAVPVSTRVNKPANDGPGCIEPVAVALTLFGPELDNQLGQHAVPSPKT